jgi:CDP-glycerol:poly(glycerophosphate) glycerophosphotransferase
MSAPSALMRSLKWLDARLGRLAGRRRVLFDIRTPMNLAVLRPIIDRLAEDPRIGCFATSEDSGAATWLDPERAPARIVDRRRVGWLRVDLYVNADPWASLTLYRCARRLNFFHGVAGKYDLDAPGRLPIPFNRYDKIAFINADRLQRYVSSGVISPAQAALIGFPKIDALARGTISGAAVRQQLGLSPARPTAVYAPTFSPASSLHLAGEAIVETLLDAGWNVIVKLHDRSMIPTDKYTDGIDWPERFRCFAARDGFAFADTGDPTPLLAAADLTVTDHSTIGFEFLLLDRPLVIYDAPDLARTARINPEKIALLRGAARVVHTVEQLREAAAEALRDPSALSAERRRLASEMFYQAGTATDRAVALVYELLNLEPKIKTAGAFAPAAAA